MPLPPTMRVYDNFTAYAGWQAITITFNANDGTETAPFIRTLTHGVEIGTLPLAPRRQGASLGHRFVGWFTHPAEGGMEIVAGDIAGDSSIVVYARWECNVALWPSRLRHQWYRSNTIPLRAFEIPVNLDAVWHTAMNQGVDNWNLSIAPVTFVRDMQPPGMDNDIGTNNRVHMYNPDSGALGYFWPPTHDRLLDSFRITLYPAGIERSARSLDVDISILITFVMAHELGHAVGLRDGGREDYDPTILGGDINASIMNTLQIGNSDFPTAPTPFDIESVRLIYDW